ncbi:MAG: hypothetical protein R3B47_19455 [Bacteroidia bacterium]
MSNFLLWEIGILKSILPPSYGPTSRRTHLYEAIVDFQRRERCFWQDHEQL